MYCLMYYFSQKQKSLNGMTTDKDFRINTVKISGLGRYGYIQ